MPDPWYGELADLDRWTHTTPGRRSELLTRVLEHLGGRFTPAPDQPDSANGTPAQVILRDQAHGLHLCLVPGGTTPIGLTEDDEQRLTSTASRRHRRDRRRSPCPGRRPAAPEGP